MRGKRQKKRIKKYASLCENSIIPLYFSFCIYGFAFGIIFHFGCMLGRKASRNLLLLVSDSSKVSFIEV